MAPIPAAVRRTITTGDVLETPTGQGAFSVVRIDDTGIVLLLGAKEAWTPLRWDAIEGVGDFLNHGRWVRIGSVYTTGSDPDTFDGYLKGHLQGATAGWVAVVLERAGVLEIDRHRPVRVRLTEAYRSL